MSAVIEVADLRRSYGDVHAVDGVTFRIEEHSITGLLGRNGAGKTTLMQLLTGQEFPSGGRMAVFGAEPAENADVLARLCFVKESQRYPDDFHVRHVLRMAPLFFANWDQVFADALIDEFRVPVRRRVKKLSRGQRSALGIVLGLASRAPLTVFDEPYLGLDAVARQIFYDRLLEDYAAHPRTVLLSTHLIDEVAELLEHVLVMDRGRLVLDSEAEALRGALHAVSGAATTVARFVDGRAVRGVRRLGSASVATVSGLDTADLRAATDAGLAVEALSLQQLVVSAASEQNGREVLA